MKKITEQEIQEYVSEVGDFDKEHRKGSSFYCTATHTFVASDIADLADDDIDAEAFFGVQVTLHGTWDDNWGCEWEEVIYEKVEAYQELVPEVVIPEHYVTKYKTSAFKPVFEE